MVGGGHGPLALFVWIVHDLLASVGAPFALIWDIGVLYLTMGFRHFSSALTEISLALTEGRTQDARDAFRRMVWAAHIRIRSQ